MLMPRATDARALAHPRSGAARAPLRLIKRDARAPYVAFIHCDAAARGTITARRDFAPLAMPPPIDAATATSFFADAAVMIELTGCCCF